MLMRQMLLTQEKATNNSTTQHTDSLLCGNMGHLDRVSLSSYPVAVSGKFAMVIQIHSGNIKGLSQVGYNKTRYQCTYLTFFYQYFFVSVLIM